MNHDRHRQALEDMLNKAREAEGGSEVVKWSEGKEVYGELLTKRFVKSKFGDGGQMSMKLTIRQPEGEVVTIFAPTVLQRCLEDALISEGMDVAIVCKGKSEKGDKPNKPWLFAVYGGFPEEGEQVTDLTRELNDKPEEGADAVHAENT